MSKITTWEQTKQEFETYVITRFNKLVEQHRPTQDFIEYTIETLGYITEHIANGDSYGEDELSC